LIVLEVGLGGRLDAVNVVDADVAIVSSIALDHCEWLGNNVESIGREKAGIFRANRPAIFGARAMPTTIASEARRVGAKLLRLGLDFDYAIDGATWTWRGASNEYKNLPKPALLGAVQYDNAATVLAAIEALHSRIPVERTSIEKGLRNATLFGRFQIVQWRVEWILDVAHNPAAAQTLSNNLASRAHVGRTLAVCGMFADKDVAGVVETVKSEIDLWIIAGLKGARALSPTRLAEIVTAGGGKVEHVAVDVSAACVHAAAIAQTADRIVVFGSFYTVGPALEWLQSQISDV
jgi:dihydrofolate synthase / folylpolyglutamate synthase